MLEHLATKLLYSSNTSVSQLARSPVVWTLKIEELWGRKLIKKERKKKTENEQMVLRCLEWAIMCCLQDTVTLKPTLLSGEVGLGYWHLLPFGLWAHSQCHGHSMLCSPWSAEDISSHLPVVSSGLSRGSTHAAPPSVLPVCACAHVRSRTHRFTLQWEEATVLHINSKWHD